jgi:GntR family transcriptional regulator
MLSYNSTREGIINYIKANKLKVGDKLPPESELTRKLNVSRLTVRESLKLLKGEGIVYTIHGKGTYISSDVRHIRDTIDNNLGITEMIISAGFKPGVSYFNRDLVKADGEIAKNLHVNEDTFVLVCNRVRTADGKPVVYSVDYFAPHLVPAFLNVQDKNVSIYSFLENENKIIIDNSFAELIPFACTKDLSIKLNYPIGSPLMLIKQTISDNMGSPLIYGIEYLRPDCFQIFVNRRRK